MFYKYLTAFDKITIKLQVEAITLDPEEEQLKVQVSCNNVTKIGKINDKSLLSAMLADAPHGQQGRFYYVRGRLERSAAFFAHIVHLHVGKCRFVQFECSWYNSGFSFRGPPVIKCGQQVQVKAPSIS